MDDIVKAALQKWPHVPACRGWLGLDARGDWYMRDERTQALGPFPVAKGSRIDHEKLREFIHRNYAADAQGAWYFQNGPQRVYVELEVAPWIWRIHAQQAGVFLITSHTGCMVQPGRAWLDEHGRLFLETSLGFGLVHSMDMLVAADWLDAFACPVERVAFAEMPEKFSYQLSPAFGV